MSPALGDGNPAVAVFSSTSALVVWRESESATDSKIVGSFYNSSTNTLSAPVDLINFTGFNSDPSVTALNNGNYVIAATSNTT